MDIIAKINKSRISGNTTYFDLLYTEVEKQMAQEGLKPNRTELEGALGNFDIIVFNIDNVLYFGRTEGEADYYELSLDVSKYARLYYFDVYLTGDPIGSDIPSKVVEMHSRVDSSMPLAVFELKLNEALRHPHTVCFNYSGITITASLHSSGFVVLDKSQHN